MYVCVFLSQNFMRDLGQNINKLVSEMRMAESPEAMVYLRLLGNELGYLTTADVRGMANSAAMVIGSMVNMFRTDVRSFLRHIATKHSYRTDLLNTFLFIFARHS